MASVYPFDHPSMTRSARRGGPSRLVAAIGRLRPFVALALLAALAAACSDSAVGTGTGATANGALANDGIGFGGQDSLQGGRGAGAAGDSQAGGDGAGGTADGGSAAPGPCDFSLNPGPGEPGAPCTGNANCDSGLCVEGPEGRICSRTCQECCPKGFACQQWNKEDSQFVCLPKLGALCRPCLVDDECLAVNDGALCVQHKGQEGRFCGGSCDGDADCPVGYLCQQAAGTKGAGKQCLRQQGACACSEAATLAGAKTSCAIQNDFGTCGATRTCGSGGLGACLGPVAAPETCNGADDDCDSLTDEGLGGGEPCKISNDYGSCAGSTVCNGGLITCAGTAPAADVCNGKDDDCDGKTDDEALDLDLDGKADCVDDDADGDGIPNANDCAPNDAGIAPGKPEVCNGKDDDCDGQIDEIGAQGCKVFFADADNDGFGDGAKQVCACAAEGPYKVAKGGDCNDVIATIHPDAAEGCDGGDNDCDGQTDEGFGLGGGCESGLGACKSFGKMVCAADGGGVVCSAGAAQGGAEVCNGKDDNCDGQTDEDFAIGAPCVAGKGVCAATGVNQCSGGQAVCSAKPKTGSAEKCDGLDNDCNGAVDEGCDDDQDGFCDKGMPFVNSLACPKGQGDCDDTTSSIAPGAAEVCNNKDDNCDGGVDGMVEDCSNGCGSGTRKCTAGQLGACSAPTPKCTSGACCDGCNFRPSSHKCGSAPSKTEFQCSGACGGAVQKVETWAYCSGSAATCGTSNLKTASAGTVADCTAGQLCQASGSTHSCKACSGGCSGSTCNQQPVHVICIDPQFGGSSVGACHSGVCTKDLNLDIALKLSAWLTSDSANVAGGGNWKVVLTRTTDTDPSISARIATCNNAGADRLISLAVNAYEIASAKGQESYYAKSSALSFCTTLHNAMIAETGFSNRGVKLSSGYSIIKDSAASQSCFPAPGFLSNAADAALLKDANFRNHKIAKGMLYGIQQSFGYGKFSP